MADDAKKSVREHLPSDSRQSPLHAEWLNNPHEVAVADDIIRQMKVRAPSPTHTKH